MVTVVIFPEAPLHDKKAGLRAAVYVSALPASTPGEWSAVLFVADMPVCVRSSTQRNCHDTTKYHDRVNTSGSFRAAEAQPARQVVRMGNRTRMD